VVVGVEDGDRFIVVGRLTDGKGWAVSRCKVEIDRVLDGLARGRGDRLRDTDL
jgi:hypothetical protein